MSKALLLLLSLYGGVLAGDVKKMSVMEGDSVTLNPCLKDIQKDSEIIWTYEHQGSQTPVNDDALDGRFKGRLKADPQSGSLTIKNLRRAHSGLYTAEITSITEGTSKRVFNVNVTGVFDPEADKLKPVSVNEGEPVTLKTGVKVKRDDLIVWMFGKFPKHCEDDFTQYIPCGTDVTAIAKLDGKTQEAFLDAGEHQMFSRCLSLDPATGDLSITDTKTQHSGLYLLRINTNTDTRFRKFNVTVTQSSHRSHWEIAGPVFLTAAIVLGLAVMVLILRNNKYNSCMSG